MSCHTQNNTSYFTVLKNSYLYSSLWYSNRLYCNICSHNSLKHLGLDDNNPSDGIIIEINNSTAPCELNKTIERIETKIWWQNSSMYQNSSRTPKWKQNATQSVYNKQNLHQDDRMHQGGYNTNAHNDQNATTKKKEKDSNYIHTVHYCLTSNLYLWHKFLHWSAFPSLVSN